MSQNSTYAAYALLMERSRVDRTLVLDEIARANRVVTQGWMGGIASGVVTAASPPDEPARIAAGQDRNYHTTVPGDKHSRSRRTR